MDPRLTLDVLARLATLEATVRGQEANASRLIGALTTVTNLDEQHNMNIAGLQRRIEQLEAQAESHHQHAAAINRRNQALENRAQHSEALVQQMLYAMMTYGIRVEASLPTPNSAPRAPNSAPPTSGSRRPDHSLGLPLPAWSHRVPSSSAQSSPASSLASPMQAPSKTMPPSAPLSAAQSPMPTSAFEAGVRLPLQPPSSTSALAMPPPPPLVPRHSGSVEHFMPRVDLHPNLKRRTSWQQARPNDVAQPAAAAASLHTSNAGAFFASASGGAGTGAAAAAAAGPSADAGARTSVSCEDSERGESGESGGDGGDGEPASALSGTHSVEQEAWDGFASLLNSFEMDAPTSHEAEEPEDILSRGWSRLERGGPSC